MKYSTLLSLAVLLSPFVPSAENHSEQLNLNFNSFWRYLASRSYVSQGNIQLDFSLWHFLSSCYLRCKSQISTALCSCACNWRWTELTPCFPFYLGGAAALRGQGGEAQPLPGTAGAFPPEAATRGGSRRQRAHQEEPGKVQHNRWEDQGDRLQGKEVASASNTTKLLSSGPPAEVKNPSLDCSCHLISGAAATVFCHKQTAVGNCLTAPKEMLLIGFIQGKFLVIVIVYLVYKYFILTPLYHCVHQKRITCFKSSLLNRRKIMSSMYVN